MDDKQSGKRRGLFGRAKQQQNTSGHTKPTASILMILGGIAAQRLLAHRGKGDYSDTLIKAIASGITRDLTTLAGECGRQERMLRTREARQPLLLGLSLAGLINVREQLEAVVAKYTSQLMQTNPEMRAVSLDPTQSGVHVFPPPEGQIVDSTLADVPPSGGSGPLPRPDASGIRMSTSQSTAPTLTHLTERELGSFANELREMFAAVIQAVQVILGALGSIQTTGPAQIDSALAQTRALITWLTGEERRLNTTYRISTGASAS
jgi:hypothetical protein